MFFSLVFSSKGDILNIPNKTYLDEHSWYEYERTSYTYYMKSDKCSGYIECPEYVARIIAGKENVIKYKKLLEEIEPIYVVQKVKCLMYLKSFEKRVIHLKRVPVLKENVLFHMYPTVRHEYSFLDGYKYYDPIDIFENDFDDPTWDDVFRILEGN